MTTTSVAPCPCGSGAAYDACCGRYHAGSAAPTAEALMRSRFSAFALRLPEYLIRTVDPMSRRRTGAGDFRSAFAVAWTRLEILATSLGGPDDRTGTVHFRAHHRSPAGEGAIEEVAAFVRDRGEWVYRAARR